MKRHFKKLRHGLSRLSNLFSTRAHWLRQNWFFLLIAAALLMSIYVLAEADKLEFFPATLFATLALALSYVAARYSKEKFRLDLFDKRFAIYERVVEFCSRVTQQGSLKARANNEDDVRAAIKAAEDGFRGIAYHKSRALFGPDIHSLFDELNKSYGYLVAFADPPIDAHKHHEWVENTHKHTMFIWETVNKLPQHFRPYVYFGDYRKD